MALQISVMVDSFRVGVDEGIKKAAKVGAKGVQIYTAAGDMLPENLSAARRKEIYSLLKDQGLAVAALCGDFGGHGFQIEQDNALRIDRSCQVMDLALEWGSRIVTTHIGVIPQDVNHPRRKIMLDACRKLGEYADKVGGHFAIETGPETATVLKDFLDELGTKGVGVNYDPANLLMVLGDDPIEGVYTLRDHIVHVHAKDGVMLQKSDPEVLYGFFAEGGIEDMRLGDYFREEPLTKGDVDIARWIQALREVGYDYYVTIEREAGEDPEADIGLAVETLKKLI